MLSKEQRQNLDNIYSVQEQSKVENFRRGYVWGTLITSAVVIVYILLSK